MNALELIEILRTYPPETEVEIALAAPAEGDDQIAVDRFPVDALMDWHDEEDDDGNPIEPILVLWLIAGEEEHVDALIDTLGDDDDDDDDEDHEGHDHGPNGHKH
jgi:hypothetical protein